MSLRTKFNDALKQAMLAKEQERVSTIRMIIAALKLADIDARPKGNMDGIDDAAILTLMQKLIKQRQDSIELYKQGNRQDLADKEEAEIKIIQDFMPKQMSETEVKNAIQAAIKATGAASIKDMGKVMGELKAKYTGQMDFGRAGAVIKELLSGGKN